jgi:hypothetical protein
MRHYITSLIRCLAVAWVLAVCSARAAEPAVAVIKPVKPGAATDASPAPDSVTLPACLTQLKLSSGQENEIKGIVQEYDADLAIVWKQFGDRYVQAVRVEAMLLSAIEDNLTEPQRKQVRDQRRRVAQHEKKLAATSDKPNQATSSPVSAVEEELAIVGVSLTPEQEAAADKVQEKYVSRLRSLNRDIQGLHTRLISLEADKFAEIEKALTKEQLKHLSEIRQSAPAEDAVDAVHAK